MEDRQSKIAWQTINVVSRRNRTESYKPTRTNKTAEIAFPESTRKPTESYKVTKQLDIKLGPFTPEELNSILRKSKNRKAAGLDEIPPEVWKTRQFDDILLRHCNAVYNQNQKNYRGITLISIAAKIYNALQCNRIEPKIDNILMKNQNVFRRNRSTTSQILTTRRILEDVRAKKPTGNNVICRLYHGL